MAILVDLWYKLTKNQRVRDLIWPGYLGLKSGKKGEEYFEEEITLARLSWSNNYYHDWKRQFIG